MLGYQLIALLYGSNSNSDKARTALGRGRVNWCAAVGAKRLDANRSVVRTLFVDFQFAGKKLKCARLGWRDRAISGPRQSLTICAVTNEYMVEINFGAVLNLAAMAGAVNIHCYTS